ncbi:hypothetical protein [Caldimonas taiwanensis]|jgi:hypothetical protein|uniref:hypothetical protein n=1 Tax=Caldimonas taiwanensis TaxID=307483 RepID=UPI00078318FE|nr:hypothetical protein [Caldimonas taiwanensis]
MNELNRHECLPQPQAREITDPDERLRVWADTHAGDLELQPLPSWMQPSRRIHRDADQPCRD